MTGNAPPCVRVMELAWNVPRSAVNEPVQQHQFQLGNRTSRDPQLHGAVVAWCSAQQRALQAKIVPEGFLRVALARCAGRTKRRHGRGNNGSKRWQLPRNGIASALKRERQEKQLHAWSLRGSSRPSDNNKSTFPSNTTHNWQQKEGAAGCWPLSFIQQY